MAESVKNIKDIRALADAELQLQLEKFRQDLWAHKLKIKDGSVTQSHPLRLIRRQIARVHTVMRERSAPKGQSKS